MVSRPLRLSAQRSQRGSLFSSGVRKHAREKDDALCEPCELCERQAFGCGYAALRAL
jgi:hypothetical protein